MTPELKGCQRRRLTGSHSQTPTPTIYVVPTSDPSAALAAETEAEEALYCNGHTIVKRH